MNTFFGYEELALMSLYDTGSRAELIETLSEVRGYLTEDEWDVAALIESCIEKLGDMTDDDYAELDLTPDSFDEEMEELDAE